MKKIIHLSIAVAFFILLICSSHTSGCINQASQSVNVKSFGAKGNGKTDDGDAINRALASGRSVFFPAGEYIIGKGALILKNKRNIRIYGEGNRTWIHPPAQLTPTQKTTYHSTLSIDNCENITIENIRVESKGENWGDADAGAGVAYGNERTNWVIQKGGHALVITRSINVNVKKVTGRFCGSTGVFYTSSCDNITFINCFANAASLGYAGFCADNFVNAEINFLPKRRYSFLNCQVKAEPKAYPGKPFSSKAGIVAEGDDARLLNIYIKGGQINDCGAGGNLMTGGAAVVAENSNIQCEGLQAKDNYIGIKIVGRSEIKQAINSTITKCGFYDNKVCGVLVNCGFKKGGNIKIINSTFTINPNSIWGFTKDAVVSETSGIITQGYMSQKIFISGTSFTGGTRYLLACDKSQINIINSRFSGASKSSFEIYGGGDYDIKDSYIEMKTPARLANQNLNKEYSGEYKYNFENNKLVNFDQKRELWELNNKALPNIKNEISTRKNQISMATVSNTAKQSPSPGPNSIVISHALQGENTSVVLRLTDRSIMRKAAKIKSGSETFELLSIVPEWADHKDQLKVFLKGDVRKYFMPQVKTLLY